MTLRYNVMLTWGSRSAMAVGLMLLAALAVAQDPPAEDGTAEEQPKPKVTNVNDLSGNQVNYEPMGENTMVVTGTDIDLDIIEALIEQLALEDDQSTIGFVRLENARANELANQIEQIFQQVHPAEELTIVAHEASNSLIIAAPDEIFGEIEALAMDLDASTPKWEPEYEVLQLEYIPASEAATLLQEYLQEAVKQSPSGDKILEKIQIVPIDRANKLNVTAPKEYIEQIRELVALFDVEPSGLAKAELLYIPLLNANADALANSLTEMLEAQGQQAEELKEKILRLSVTKVGPDGEIEKLPELDLEKPMKIVPEENTNALIIATHDANVEPMRELVRLLDSVPVAPEMGIEFFTLKYGDAETVAGVLTDLFASGKNLPQVPGDKVKNAVPEGIPGEALVYEIAIHADKRTNSIVVAGRPVQVALAQTIVQQLDVEGKAFFPKAEFLYLENTDPERVASVLTQLNEAAVNALTERDAGAAAIEREKATIISDHRANAVIIMATEDKFAELSELALKLDAVPEDYRNDIRIITCENINAATLVDKVQSLWERKREIYDRQEIPPDMPVVVADERSNALVIASSVEDYEAIKRLVESLEQQPLQPMAMIRLIQIENNDSAALATMLQSIFQERLNQVPSEQENETERVAIASDPATNIMLVASSPNNFEEIQRIVEALDIVPELDSVVRSFQLKDADAANVHSKIEELVITQGLYRPGALGTDSAVSDAREHIAMIADERSNSLMVSASQPNMKIIEELVKRMDRSDIMDFGAARIFQLEHADALKAADILTQVFEGLEQSLPQGSQTVFVKPTFIPVEGSNALIVTGSRDAMARTEDLLVKIDKPSDSPSAKFEVYTLKHAAAIKLASKVQEMFDARAGGSGDGQRTPLNIQAVEGSNSLLVSASQEDHSVLEGLIEMLDIKSSLNQQLRIFNLEHARAEASAEVLTQLFQQEGTDGPANAIAVEAVPWTDSLVVWATAGQMDDIEKMVTRLDDNKPEREVRFEIIQLKQAMATELSEAITSALTGEGTAGDDLESAVIFSFFAKLDDGERELRKLIRQDISIIPYAQTNTLLVMAPPDSADMLLSLIEQVDAIPPITADFKFFQLVNADAEQVIDTLETIFESEAGADGEVTVNLTADGGTTTTTTGGDGGGPSYGMTFAPDLRTNSVIATGNAEYLALVGELIEDLDREAPETRVVEHMHLNNSVAEDVAARLNDFNEAERDRLSELDDTISPYMLAQQLVTVVPDERTNSVYMSMSPRVRDQYMDFVAELDRAPEQVLIEFMLVEVTLDDLFELGMEFTVSDLAFSAKAVQGPNGTILGPNKDVVLGTSLGAAGSGGGFTLTVTGEDFSFLFHALQTAGRAELISRPSLVAEDNAEDARIAIINEVPTLRSVGADNAGNQITQVEYVDTGIELQVTPHINPDGFIQLELDSRVDSVGPQVQVGETSSVSIQGTQLTTTVTVKDGETVIIGGLIETSLRENEQKVPLLGDLPVVGQIFRTNSDQGQRRELLVVITATIIRSQEDARRMSIQQRDATDIVPETLKRSPMMGTLQIRPQAVDALEIEDRDMLQQPEGAPQGEVYGPQPTRTYGPVVPGRLRRDAATEAPRRRAHKVSMEVERDRGVKF